MTQLDPFQHEVLDFLQAAGGRAVYADPMGSRKTGTTLTWLATNPVGNVLVVAPRSVHGHWAREAARFYPEVEVYLGAGTKSNRGYALSAVALYKQGLYITTYESMKSDEDAIRQAGFDTVVFDEGHKLKGRRTAVALCANAVCRQARHIIIATGTPVLNHAAELWQYLNMLKPGVYRSYWTWVEKHFRIEYAYFNGRGGQVTKVVHGFLPGHEAEVRAEMKDIFIQREIGELFPGEAWVAEPEHVEIEVELSPKERKAYDSLVKHQWAEIEGVVVQTENKLALTTRLQQLTSEWGSLDENLDDGTKVTLGAELIAELSLRGPVIAFTKFKATAEHLVEALAKTTHVRLWTGDTSADIKEDILHGWKEGKVDVVVGTLASMGEGVDGFQYRASQIVMLDRDWTPARNDQAIGRLRRSGQQERVIVYHLYAKDTIDAWVVDACLRKQNVIQSLNGRPLKDILYGKRG